MACRHIVALALVALSTAFTPAVHLPPAPTQISRRAVAHPLCVASSSDKLLLQAAKKVLFAAKSFGRKQGEVAQLWVEEALRGGDATAAGLEMIETALFDECKLEDGGKCEQLTSGMDELLALVEQKQGMAPSTGFFAVKLGAAPVHAATVKVKAAARKFGAEQESTAEAWIKKVVGGEEMGDASLLQEQIMLFSECALSEGCTLSDCEELEDALAELQAALEACDITSSKVGRVASTNIKKPLAPPADEVQSGRVAPTNLKTLASDRVKSSDASSTQVGRVAPTKPNKVGSPMADEV